MQDRDLHSNNLRQTNLPDRKSLDREAVIAGCEEYRTGGEYFGADLRKKRIFFFQLS
jgi:hypothetical protein